MSAGYAPAGGGLARVTVACWTGRAVWVLRVAARMPVGELAARLQVPEQVLVGWDADPGAPVPVEAQVGLDEVYAGLEAAAAERFAVLAALPRLCPVITAQPVTGQVPGPGPAPVDVDGAGTGAPNLALHALMRAGGMSRPGLAAAVTAEAVADGRGGRVGVTQVDRWLSGRSAGSRLAGHVAAVLSDRLGRLVTVEETGLTTSRGSRLRELRATHRPRPWTQARLVVAMESAARELGQPLGATRASLKVQVSRWENQHAQIGPDYRQVLARALNCQETDLDDPPTALAGPVPVPAVGGVA